MRRLGSPRRLMLIVVVSLTKGQTMMGMEEPKVGKVIPIKVHLTILLNGSTKEGDQSLGFKEEVRVLKLLPFLRSVGKSTRESF